MKPFRLNRLLSCTVVGWSLAGAASAGVIVGTGSAPSATQLGATDAVGYVMADSGPGHALVVPYFTAQGGKGTVLHLVNQDEANGKVVKLRFRGAANGDRLLSLQVLLAPADVWTVLVSQGTDGVAQIVTADSSCTLPVLAPLVPQAFFTNRLNPHWDASALANNTREGYIEAIVVADIPSTAVYGSGNSMLSTLYTTIKPGAAARSCRVEVLNAALLDDTSNEAEAAGRGLATPSGGVSGSWYIIDAANTTAFSGAATAFKAVNASGQKARGNYVLFPQKATVLSAPETYTSDPLLVSTGQAGRSKDASGNLSNLTTAAAVEATFNDLPDLSTPYYLPASSVNARITAGDVTRLLAVRQLSNQFSTEAAIAAKTDWVFSMPTKRLSVGLDYSQTSSTSSVVPSSALVFSAVPPAGAINQYFHSGNTVPSASSSTPQSCTQIAPAYGSGGPPGLYNRDSAAMTSATATASATQRQEVCGPVQVLSFLDSGASALGSGTTKRTLSTTFSSGWHLLKTTDPITGLGHPLLGASFIKLSNPSVQPGVSGNYGISWPHSSER